MGIDYCNNRLGQDRTIDSIVTLSNSSSERTRSRLKYVARFADRTILRDVFIAFLAKPRLHSVYHSIESRRHAGNVLHSSPSLFIPLAPLRCFCTRQKSDERSE